MPVATKNNESAVVSTPALCPPKQCREGTAILEILSMTIVTRPNYQITHDFLTVLGNGETRFTFQTFDDNQERRNSSLARVFNGTLEEHQEELTQLNSKGAGVFVNVCQTDLTGREKQNITGVRALFIDCDERLPTSFRLQPSIIVQSSSSGKGHVYWLLDETVKEHKTLSQRKRHSSSTTTPTNVFIT